MDVGIPRALSYYRYYPFMKTAVEGMGCNVVLSSPTGKTMLENGLRHCVDDICVPVKVYYGHVLDLVEKVDVLLVSRLVSVEKGNFDTYTCPKMIGLPDMIKYSINRVPPTVEHIVDIQNSSWKKSVKDLGEALGAKPSIARRAYREAIAAQSRFEALLLAGHTPQSAMTAVLEDGRDIGDSMFTEKRPPRETAAHKDRIKIALIGHEYLIHDRFVSHDLPGRLEKQGVEVIYSSQVSPWAIENELEKHPEISWSFEKELLGSAYYFQGREDIDGVMLVMCFACGPDSIVGEMISREYHREPGPAFTTMVLDEHTGEAGVATRVEAFVDMIRRCRVRP